MPSSDWHNKSTTVTNADVFALFDEFSFHYLKEYGKELKCFTIVENHISKNYEEAMAIYTMYLNFGMEGAIIKKMTDSYEWTRSDQWLKLVPSISIDLLITGIELADKGSKYEGMVGAFSGSGVDEAGRNIISSVGSGISDAMRKHATEHPDFYIGKIMECKARQYSKDERTGQLSVRFVTFKRLREK